MVFRFNSMERAQWLMARAPDREGNIQPTFAVKTNQDYVGLVVNKFQEKEGGETHWVYHVLLSEDIVVIKTSMYGNLIGAQLGFKPIKQKEAE